MRFIFYFQSKQTKFTNVLKKTNGLLKICLKSIKNTKLSNFFLRFFTILYKNAL